MAAALKSCELSYSDVNGAAVDGCSTSLSALKEMNDIYDVSWVLLTSMSHIICVEAKGLFSNQMV